MSETRSARILVVEDEPDIAALVMYQLAHAGHTVRTASTGGEALGMVEREVPDLIVLDLMLPEIGGLEVLRMLRGRASTEDVPVLVLTARTAEEDRIAGLELGADDYLAKPFSPRELVLRVNAVLKRTGTAEGRDTGAVYRTGPLVVDMAAHRVTVDGREIDLTPTEFRLLTCLLERRGRTQSRRALLQAVWDTTAEIETRTVDMHVGRLRSKLEEAGELIETVRGFGYRFRRED